KGARRNVTVYKDGVAGRGGQGGRGEEVPELILGPGREALVDAYFAEHPVTDLELGTVMELVTEAGGGMHTATGLAQQKRHKVARLERQAAAIATEKGMSNIEVKERVKSYWAAQKRRASSQGYLKMLNFRKGLPAWAHREQIVKMVRDNQVCLVSGETGCGKSTQVPQFLLDDFEHTEAGPLVVGVGAGVGAGSGIGEGRGLGPGCKIVCTQPRRISTIAVAERIAEERGEKIGDKVGYSIRLESSASMATQLMLMTPGILLKKLHTDPMLKEFTHILIDEVHERDRNSEFLLIVLRRLLPKRPDLKVVLMSATLQQGKYSDYFGGCPITTIGARTFPVQAFFLEDVLLQTRYLEEIGVVTGPGGGELDLGGGSIGSGIGGIDSSSFTCITCGKNTFRSAEELGTHVATCFGVEGTDPSLEGMEQGALRALLGGVDPSGRRGEALDTTEPVGTGEGKKEEEVEDGWEQGGVGSPMEEEEVGRGGATAEEEEEEEGLGVEDDVEEGLHDALATIQKWDGKGMFRGERAGASGQADDLLLRYQFAFDDEMVDYSLIECLLRYICHSAYEDGAVLVFLPGWDDISRH
ncbi:unnamed protein product, partial [Discosporangium mesarthrocarpum]